MQPRVRPGGNRAGMWAIPMWVAAGEGSPSCAPLPPSTQFRTSFDRRSCHSVAILDISLGLDSENESRKKALPKTSGLPALKKYSKKLWHLLGQLWGTGATLELWLNQLWLNQNFLGELFLYISSNRFGVRGSHKIIYYCIRLQQAKAKGADREVHKVLLGWVPRRAASFREPGEGLEAAVAARVGRRGRMAANFWVSSHW